MAPYHFGVPTTPSVVCVHVCARLWVWEGTHGRSNPPSFPARLLLTAMLQPAVR